MTDQLFEAFVAGFACSFEGWNGELCGADVNMMTGQRAPHPWAGQLDDRTMATLRDKFETYRKEATSGDQTENEQDSAPT